MHPPTKRKQNKTTHLTTASYLRVRRKHNKRVEHATFIVLDILLAA